MSVLASLGCVIDANGITAPSYADIVDTLVAGYQGIYGQDTYLDPDSQDGQWIGILAQGYYDCNQVAVAVYNQFSPATSIGVGLSSVVKINGIARDIPTNSTCVVTIVGVVGTQINGGIVGDDAGLGTQWALPATVNIPLAGTIDVTATSTSPGAVTAAPGTLTQILTPTPGWQTVTNAGGATEGAPVESDAQLRVRQSKSTALPSQYPLEGIVAAVANVTGVQRVAGYQNDTNVTDADGIPAHNISIVVSGGDALAIATAIALKKAPGTPTYGTTSEIVLDSKGVPSHVNFFELTNITMSVIAFATALTGYVNSTGDYAVSAIVEYLNNLDIGEDSEAARIWAPADLKGDDATAATGLSQAQLNQLSLTYKVQVPFGIAQARDNMTVTGGPYGAGSTSVSVTDATNYAIGSICYLTLDDGSYERVTLTNVVGTALTFTPAVSAGRSVQNGALVYVVGDINIAFNEAATTDAAHVDWMAA